MTDYVYDYTNRLTASCAYNGGGTLTDSADYVNDPLDRPVKETETHSGTATTTTFTYSGASNATSREVLTGGTNTTKTYAYDALGQRATIADGSNRYSYLYDPHGSVSLLIDQSNGVKASYGYHAYGSSNTNLTKTAAGFNARAGQCCRKGGLGRSHPRQPTTYAQAPTTLRQRPDTAALAATAPSCLDDGVG